MYTSPTAWHPFVWVLCSSHHVHSYSALDNAPFLMVVRDSVIFGIPLDPADPSNNAMAPVSGVSQGRDIDFDDQEEFVYWVQNTVSGGLKLNIVYIFYDILWIYYDTRIDFD